MKTELQEIISPSVPFVLHRENSNGDITDSSFRLSLDLNGLCLIESTTGKSMLTDLGAFVDSATVTNITVMFWAALQENHPEFIGKEGLRAARKLLTTKNLGDVREACIDAFLIQLPKEDADRIRKIRAGEKASSPLESQTASA